MAVGSHAEASNQTTITNGATASSNNSLSASGAVYMYKRTGSNWAQEAYIKAINVDSSDQFGVALTLSGDALAVGACFESSNQTTITNGTTASSDNSTFGTGAVYVYRNNSRNYDPPEFLASDVQSTSLTFTWNTAGLLTDGYILTYSAGMTPPVDCHSGTDVDVNNVLTHQVTGLSPNTSYSFRICSYDSQNNLSGGVTSTFTTLP